MVRISYTEKYLQKGVGYEPIGIAKLRSKASLPEPYRCPNNCAVTVLWVLFFGSRCNPKP